MFQVVPTGKPTGLVARTHPEDPIPVESDERR